VGSVLQTADDAHLDLALLPNILLRLLGGGELTLESARLSKNGDETDTEMIARLAQCSLNKGTVLIAFRRPDGSAGKLEVKTPDGTVTTSANSLFSVGLISKRARVVCVQGFLAFSPVDGSKPVSMTAGWVADYSGDNARVVPIAEDSAAQTEMSEAMRIEQQLLALAGRRRDVLP
jgi:hypothetical protein